MSSLLLGCCDALVAAINRHEWSQEFTAVRRIVPVYQVEETDTLVVCVSPWRGQTEIASLTRGRAARSLNPTITIAKRYSGVADNQDAQFEPMFDLLDEMVEFLDTPAGRQLQFTFRNQQIDVSRIDDIENDPAYSEDHIRMWNQFTADITASYEVHY